MAALIADLAAEELSAGVVEVDYAFQHGARSMLVVNARDVPARLAGRALAGQRS